MIKYDEATQEIYDSLGDKEKEAFLSGLASQATNDPDGRRCTLCHQAMFHVPDRYARIQGHVYSPAGWRETGITGYCEFCFDGIFGSWDDEDDE